MTLKLKKNRFFAHGSLIAKRQKSIYFFGEGGGVDYSLCEFVWGELWAEEGVGGDGCLHDSAVHTVLYSEGGDKGEVDAFFGFQMLLEA